MRIILIALLALAACEHQKEKRIEKQKVKVDSLPIGVHPFCYKSREYLRYNAGGILKTGFACGGTQ